jgi:uncharacterized protein YbjT (DUF2867 family)
MTSRPIVIIGHKGKTGSRVQQRLEQLGHATRGVSRSTNPAFDWEHPATWRPALEGARAAYVTYQPDLAVPGAQEDIHTLIREAKSAGIEHLVMLSGRGEEGAQKAEQILMNSGLTWNLVRASWFAQNFSESFMLEGILAGNLSLPADTVQEPFVDTDDIADVAVAVLTDPKLHNRLFEVSGPRALTFADCVQIISEATGRPVQYTPVSLDAYLHSLEAMGIPEDFRWLMNELFGTVLDGRNTPVTDGVQQALNRPATDFRDYVAKTMATGVWNQAPIQASA